MSAGTRTLLTLLVVGAILAGCSQVKPATPEAAEAEATATLDSLGTFLFGDSPYVTTEWAADNGCAVPEYAPHVGKVSMLIQRKYQNVVPSDRWEQAQRLVDVIDRRWRDEGLETDRSSADMSPSVSTTRNGIRYSVWFMPPTGALAAFLPCY